MPYQLPSYTVLRARTLNLEAELNQYLGRYSISNANKTNNTLYTLISRANDISNAKTERESERQVILDLVNELRPFIDDDEGVKNINATYVLLGALIHRYKRLIKWADTRSYFYQINPLDSGLFQAIRYILKLSEQISMTKDEIKLHSKTFRSDDAKILDEMTVYYALKAFQTYMYQEDEWHRKNYMNYVHLKQDPNFETNLQEIIDESGKKAQSMIIEYKPLKFLKSCVTILDNEMVLCRQSTCQLIETLKNHNVELKKIDGEQLIQFVEQHIKNETEQKSLCQLISTDKIYKDIQSLNYKTLQQSILKCKEDLSSYALMACYLLVNQTRKLHPCLKNALSLKGDVRDIDESAQYLGLKTLKSLIKLKPDLNFDCEFFGNKEQMIKQLYQMKLEKKSVTLEFQI